LGKTSDLLRKWRRHGHDIGFGVGIPRGYDARPDWLAEPLIKTAMGTLSDPASERRSAFVKGFGCRPVVDLYSRVGGRRPKASEERTRGGW
jgi:hypothetical protein